MEYSTDNGATWIDYNPTNIPAFEGKVTLMIRPKISEDSLPGEAVTLTFTEDI